MLTEKGMLWAIGAAKDSKVARVALMGSECGWPAEFVEVAETVCNTEGAKSPDSPKLSLQELFDRWYRAERSVIHEFSGDIAAAMRSLHADATAFAARHSLICPELDDWHLEDEEVV